MQVLAEASITEASGVLEGRLSRTKTGQPHEASGHMRLPISVRKHLCFRHLGGFRQLATWVTLSFLFFHTLKSSCYVLNLPIKSEPIKHLGSILNPETESQTILSLFLSLPSTPMCIRVLHASRSRRAKGGWIASLWSLPKKKLWTEGMRKGFQ